jgi:hypothetical protein
MLSVLECRASVDYARTSCGLVRSTLRTVRTIVERNMYIVMHDLIHDDSVCARVVAWPKRGHGLLMASWAGFAD